MVELEAPPTSFGGSHANLCFSSSGHGTKGLGLKPPSARQHGLDMRTLSFLKIVIYVDLKTTNKNPTELDVSMRAPNQLMQ
jgi:hypothetical protein